jgi:hypothetical protein
VEIPPQKQKGIRKALKDRVIGSLERTAKLEEKGKDQQLKSIKGKKLQLEYDDNEWEEECRNDTEDMMEMEEPERVVAAMHPTAQKSSKGGYGETRCTTERRVYDRGGM